MGKTEYTLEVEQQGDHTDPYEFEVIVREDGEQTRHRVTMGRSTFDQLSNGVATAENCVRAAFAFLLERESKDSILSQFDVSVISRYFPEFEDELERYL